MTPAHRMRPLVLLMFLPLVTSTALANDAVHTTCLADPVCRRVYHQFPPNRAVFDALYALGTDAPEGSPAAASVAVRARLADVHVCPWNERYVVDAAGRGTCVCPDATTPCGPLTPFNNVVVYVACAAGTAAIWMHVGMDLLRSTNP